MKKHNDVYEILNDGKLRAQLVYQSDDETVKVFNWDVKYGDITIMSGSVVTEDGKIYRSSLDDSGFYRAVMVYDLMPDIEREILLRHIQHMGDRIAERRIFIEGDTFRVQDIKTEIMGARAWQ